MALRRRGESALDKKLRALLRSLAPDSLEPLGRLWEILGDDLYGLALWRTGSSADAEDAVQEVFARLARLAGKLNHVRDPRAYLFAMVHNAAVDLVTGRRHRQEAGEVPQLFISDRDAGEQAEARRASELVAHLPPAQREVVYLRYFKGLSFREIAKVTGVSIFTVASRCRLAIRRLRKSMGVKTA